MQLGVLLSEQIRVLLFIFLRMFVVPRLLVKCKVVSSGSLLSTLSDETLATSEKLSKQMI